MSKKMCPKIILEGTRLTFKTDIAFHLNRHPDIVGPRKYEYHSPLISAEWCAFTNYPWGVGMINFEPDMYDKAMETYKAWLHIMELQKYYSWIIDRWHISTQAFQLLKYEKKIDFTWLEKRMKAIGFQLVFLHREPETFEHARELRLKISGNPSQYNDLSLFVKEQNTMQELVAKSMLPVLNVDISNNHIERAVQTIADWMHQTDAIWANY